MKQTDTPSSTDATNAITKKKQSPHDAVVKRFLCNPKYARNEFEVVLPKDITQHFDWSTLTHEPGSSMDAKLDAMHTDLTFSVSFNNPTNPTNSAKSTKSKALVYLLLEHQRTQDRWMPWRIACYTIRTLERWLLNHKEATKLPLLIPMVLYNGESKWTAPRALSELFEGTPEQKQAIGAYMLEQRFFLDDLSQYTDEQLKARHLDETNLMLMRFLKFAPNHPNFMSKIREWFQEFRSMLGSEEEIERAITLFIYAIAVNSDIKETDMKQYINTELNLEWDYVQGSVMDQIVKRHEREAAEIAMQQGMQRGRQQGMQQGRQEGMQQGMQRGRQEGVASLLLNLLRAKFSNAITPAIENQVVHAEIADLDQWSKRVLTADTLRDVFR